MSTPGQRQKMAKTILDFEARRDKNHNLMVYNLPPGDGGGRYEVGGINEKYDKEAVDQLVAMIQAGKFDKAELFATEYIAKNTDPATTMTTIPSIESYLRDIIFNRGVAGAIKHIQIAAGFAGSRSNPRDVDGVWGPKTAAAMRQLEKDPQKLLANLRDVRERYERQWAGRDESSQFWKGLVNRWNNSLVVAKSFPDVPTPSTTATPETPVAPSIVVPVTAPPAAPAPRTGWLELIGKTLSGALSHPTTGPAPSVTGAPVAPASPPIDQTQGKFLSAPDWFRLGLKDLGFHEVGNNQGIEKFIEQAHTGSLGDPWCAIWANAKIEQAGLRGTRSPSSQSFRDDPNFIKLQEPALGAIVVFYRGGKDSGLGHVGFYVGETKDYIQTLGGNEDDQVEIELLAKDSGSFGLVGYYWPRSRPLPEMGAIPVAANTPKHVTSVT